jgi:hypothetical protein
LLDDILPAKKIVENTWKDFLDALQNPIGKI